MGDNDTTRTVSWFTPLYYIALSLLGYFVYGGLYGAGGIFLMAFGLSLLLVIAIIPLLGVVLWWLGATWMVPNIYALTGIYQTWLTGLIFTVTGILALFITFLTGVYLLTVITN